MQRVDRIDKDSIFWEPAGGSGSAKTILLQNI
jgi:hypothetical protein